MMIKDNLRKLMHQKNLNPEKLAVKLQEAGYNKSYATVIGWYHGYRNPNVSGIKALAAVLDVPIDTLTEHVPAPSPEAA